MLPCRPKLLFWLESEGPRWYAPNPRILNENPPLLVPYALTPCAACDCSCIELGSGSQALPGLAASALGSSRVVVSDTGHEIIRLLSTNVKRNAGACKGRSVEAKDHFWGGEVGGLGGPFDWILVAEFCYIDDAMKPLVDSMRRLSHGGTTVVCSYGRNRRSEDVFKVILPPMPPRIKP